MFKYVDFGQTSLHMSKTECAVCFEETTDKLLCGHTICGKCSAKWLADHCTCPICRKNIKQVEYAQESQDTHALSTSAISTSLSTSTFASTLSAIFTPRFDVWLANTIINETVSLESSRFHSFLQSVYINTKFYTFQITDFGIKVVGHTSNKFWFLMHHWRYRNTLKIGDIITHVNGFRWNRAVNHVNFGLFCSCDATIRCHILDRYIFSDLPDFAPPPSEMTMH